MGTDKIDDHDDATAAANNNRLVQCEQCRESIVFDQQQLHATRCPEEQVECQGCSEVMTRKNLGRARKDRTQKGDTTKRRRRQPAAHTSNASPDTTSYCTYCRALGRGAANNNDKLDVEGANTKTAAEEQNSYFVISVQTSKQQPPTNKDTSNDSTMESETQPQSSVTTTQSGVTNNDNNKNNDTVHVLVIAHPDDESMFFLPTIQSLQQAGETVWIICLTTGNYDGLGGTRQNELSKACSLLGIAKLIQLDVEGLQDHPNQAWSLDVVATELEKALSIALRSSSNTTATTNASQQHKYKRVVLITFDMDGVSGHANHRDTYLGVRNLVLRQQKQQLDLATTANNNEKGDNNNNNNNNNLLQSEIAQQSNTKRTPTNLPQLEAWQLDTVHSLPFKYLPVTGWCLCLLSVCRLWKPTGTRLPHPSPSNNSSTNANAVQTYRSVDPLLSWKAMAAHESQFVWYRRLFVVFSCYTFVNKLRPVQ